MGVGLQGNIKLNFQCISRGDMCIGDFELREVKTIMLPKPEEAFEKSKVFLSIQPHTDDTDIAAGGTVAKLANDGCQIIYVTVTDGGAGAARRGLPWETMASIRRREQESAAKILGVSELLWLDYRDSELKPTLELRNRLITLIRRFKPDVVLTVDPWLTYEAHPDHRVTGLAATEAFFFSGLPNVNPVDFRNGLEPYTPTYIAYYWSRKPNVYVDIGDWIDVKFKAVKAHTSQVSDAMVELLRKISTLLGARVGYQYAEAFKVLNTRTVHCNTYAADL